MKNPLDRQLIESLNESNNQEFLENVNSYVYDLMDNVMEEISQKSPFIRMDKCVLQPVNEISTGSFTQLSEYDYFLGVDNPQIESNSKTRKNFWKRAWREFKAAWRLGRKKYKKTKESREGLSTQTSEKYKLNNLKHDLLKKTAEYLQPTSIVTEYSNYISMVGSEDFGTGVKINIYVCMYDSKNNLFKLYNDVKNKYKIVDFGKRFSNIDLKVQECGQMYLDMIKIFNAIFSKAYNRVPNQILIESLLFNCPNVLFDEDDVFKTFVNVANYIRLANPKSIASICDTSKNIFEEPLILGGNKQVDFSRVISMLDRFKW